MRGICLWPDSYPAARKARIWAACWMWSGSPVASNLRVEVCRFSPSFAGPCGCPVGNRPRPDFVPQSCRVWLKRQQSRRIGKHWTWVRLSEALAAQQLKKFFGMPPAHICIVLAFNWAVAKVAPTTDDLLGGTAADSQLQSTAGAQIPTSSAIQ
jgi:hypothetical protein